MQPPKIRRLLDAAFQIKETAELDFEDVAAALAENIGRRIAASLGADPDLVFPPDGSDGRMVGRTAFEQLMQSVSGADAVRAVVLAADVADIEDFVAQAGSLRARDILLKAVQDLAGLAEKSLIAQGVAAAGVLDTAAAEALISTYVTTSLDAAIRLNLDAAAAARIRQGIIANMGQMSIAEVAEQIAIEQGAAVNAATTAARTQLAEADRFVQETVRKTVDPDGKRFLMAYIGPDDRITRPFCTHLVNKAFKLEDFNRLRNGQTATHPRISGGGYNCRHDVRPVLNDEKVLKSMRLRRGTLADIQEANEAARPKRRKRKKGRRT